MTDTRLLPGPSSVAWSDPDIVPKILAWADLVLPEAEHSRIHTKPQPGCPACPPVACFCGVADCADASAHIRSRAASETTWREAAL